MFLNRKTILYFAPHQDDELLTMGTDICNSVAKGHNVHVILCTDGSRSRVKDVLNNGKTCGKHEGTHCYALSDEEFIQARDREFLDSCLALGVKARNIHMPKSREVDGSLSLQYAERIIKNHLLLWDKNALVCTISQNNGSDQHPDHKILGKAAENLLKRGLIQELRLFIEPYLFEKVEKDPRMIPVAPVVLLPSDSSASRIKKAIEAYSLWDPQQKRYAVGRHSVSTEFQDFQKNPCSRYFTLYNPKTMSSIQKLRFQHRKWLKLQKQEQIYFSCKPGTAPDLGNWKLVSIQPGQTENYRSFCDTYAVKFNEKNLQRIAEGASFWCLVSEENEIATSGWLAYQQPFYVGETDFGFEMGDSNTGLLFAFGTEEKYRGLGLYPLLLKTIISQAQGPEQFIIYTSPVNTASQRGVLKAGFTCDGSLSAADGSLPDYLAKHGFTKIYRKYQHKGLKVLP